MTTADAFLALADRVGAEHPASAKFSDDELSRWPASALRALKAQKLLRRAPPAKAVICPGCEQQCVMPVHVAEGEESGASPFVLCDKRSDINRVRIAPEQLAQWKSEAEALCGFVAQSLGLQRSAGASKDPGLAEIGIGRGTRRLQMLALRATGEPTLLVGDKAVPLSALVTFENGRYGLDGAMVGELVDSSTVGDPRYTSSTARREVRKHETVALRAAWKREYRKLRRAYPGQTDVWISRKIAKSPIADGRSAETIRRSMKP